MIAVAITDIQPGDVGDGFAEGVFLYLSCQLMP
jgi:predicted RecA/RadA family phage recombinase